MKFLLQPCLQRFFDYLNPINDAEEAALCNRRLV